MPGRTDQRTPSTDRTQTRLHGLRSFRGAVIGVGIALCVAGCASESTSPPSLPDPTPKPTSGLSSQRLASEIARPPFYRVDGGRGATLLLMGTIHLGPKEGWTFSPALEDGLEQADSFVLELDLSLISEDRVGTTLANLVIIESPKTLEDLLSPETTKILADNDALLSRMGLPFNARKRFKPWYIAMNLIESATVESGLSTSASAESVIQSAAGARPVLGLETFDEQLNMLDDIDPSLQDMMLRDTVEGLGEAAEEILAHASAWQAGDETALAALARDGIDEMPEFEKFYDVILGERNRRWMPTLRSLLDDPMRNEEIIFVGVGSLHLLRDDGLIELFRQADYRVTAIDHSLDIKGKNP